MYTRLNDVIRKNDDHHIIFFEHAVSDSVGEGGLTQGPGGRNEYFFLLSDLFLILIPKASYNDRQVLSYHIYCITDAKGDVGNVYACDFLNEYFYDMTDTELEKLGVAGFLTEYKHHIDSLKHRVASF